jgi:hypothetical protein
MNNIFIFLSKGLISDYFKRSLFVLSFVILLCFGFVRMDFHFEIIKRILFNPYYLIISVLIFSLYFVYNVLQLIQILGSENHLDVYNLLILPIKKKWMAYFYIYSNTHFLSLAYLILIIYRSFLLNQTWAIAFFLAFHLLSFLLMSWIFETRIKRPLSIEKWRLKLFSFTLPLPFSLYPFKEIINSKALGFLMTKLLVILVCYGFYCLYPTDDYDLRLWNLVGIILASMQFQLLSEWLIIEINHGTSFKALPLNNIKLIYFDCSNILILTCFDLIIFNYYSYSFLNAFDRISASILFLSFILFIRYLYYFCSNIEGFLKYLFFSFVIISILVMYHISALFISLVLLIFIVFLGLKKRENWSFQKNFFDKK